MVAPVADFSRQNGRFSEAKQLVNALSLVLQPLFLHACDDVGEGDVGAVSIVVLRCLLVAPEGAGVSGPWTHSLSSQLDDGSYSRWNSN